VCKTVRFLITKYFLKSSRLFKNVEMVVIVSTNKILSIIYGMIKKKNDSLFEIFHFKIFIFTLKSKLSEFYSDCINEFCLGRTCVRRRPQIQRRRPLNDRN